MSRNEPLPPPDTGSPGGRASPWLTVEQAAAYLQVTVATIQRWAAAGKLRRHRARDRRTVRYHRDDLDAVMQPENPDDAS